MGEFQRIVICTLAVSSVVAAGACRTAGEVGELLVEGDEKKLDTDRTESNSPPHPKMLVVVLDGTGRDLLYDEIRGGHLPHFSRLLRADGEGKYPHALFDDDVLSTFPSITMLAWATAFTGEPMPVHGVAGNEYFDRRTLKYYSPAPVSVGGIAETLKTYTDSYLNRQLNAQTSFEALRERDENVLIWVAMLPIYHGADRLITTSRGAMLSAAEAFFSSTFGGDPRKLYEALDRETVDELLEAMKGHPVVPDVLVVYLPGTDMVAHRVEADSPHDGMREYMREVTDKAVGRLLDGLGELGDDLSDRHVLIVADHGHTDVAHDARHALGVDADGDDPPSLIEKAGFRLRPFELETDKENFNAVLSYGGAVGYAYLADRSQCTDDKCNWDAPPRYEEDVLVFANAFFENDRTGFLVPGMKDTLDMVLVRPGPDEDFVVYVGDGKTQPLPRYLKENPRDDYVDFAGRVRTFTRGPLGYRAGDVILLARNGAEKNMDDRFYFAPPYHSWHGSPSRADSEVPFIVAHGGSSDKELRRFVNRAAKRAGDRDLRIVHHYLMTIADAAANRRANAN